MDTWGFLVNVFKHNILNKTFNDFLGIRELIQYYKLHKCKAFNPLTNIEGLYLTSIYDKQKLNGYTNLHDVLCLDDELASDDDYVSFLLDVYNMFTLEHKKINGLTNTLDDMIRFVNCISIGSLPPCYYVVYLLNKHKMSKRDLYRRLGGCSMVEVDFLLSKDKQINPSISMRLEKVFPDIYSAKKWQEIQHTYNLALIEYIKYDE